MSKLFCLCSCLSLRLKAEVSFTVYQLGDIELVDLTVAQACLQLYGGEPDTIVVEFSLVFQRGNNMNSWPRETNTFGDSGAHSLLVRY